jgi:predicted ribosomally synthesized peptide with nif11-like leader
MSQEKLKAFAEAVTKSEELQKRVALIQMEAVKSTAEELAKLSESAGTPFTAEEYLRSVAESSEQLSTEQLRSVAGGGGSNIINDIFGEVLLSAVKGFSNNCVLDRIRSIVDKGDLCLFGK